MEHREYLEEKEELITHVFAYAKGTFDKQPPEREHKLTPRNKFERLGIIGECIEPFYNFVKCALQKSPRAYDWD